MFQKLFALTLLLALSLASVGAAHAQATSGTVSVNGATIAYRVQGAGPAMMLVHGYPLSGELFAKNRAALARRYRVITPDLRGFGNSTTPDSNGSVQIYAKDMLAVMDHLHVNKAIIGGMSMGGPVVLEMYREAPQRFRGLMLIDSNAGPASEVEKAEWPGYGKQAQTKGVASMIPLLLPTMLTAKTRTTQPAQVATLSDIVKQGSVKAAVGGGQTLAGRPDSMPTLKAVRVPVLILAGMDDGLYAIELQQKMHRAARGSKLVVIPGAAHAAIFEKAGAANQAIMAWAARVR